MGKARSSDGARHGGRLRSPAADYPPSLRAAYLEGWLAARIIGIRFTLAALIVGFVAGLILGLLL